VTGWHAERTSKRSANTLEVTDSRRSPQTLLQLITLWACRPLFHHNENPEIDATETNDSSSSPVAFGVVVVDSPSLAEITRTTNTQKGYHAATGINHVRLDDMAKSVSIRFGARIAAKNRSRLCGMLVQHSGKK
jgi:hypothetical protein